VNKIAIVIESSEDATAPGVIPEKHRALVPSALAKGLPRVLNIEGREVRLSLDQTAPRVVRAPAPPRDPDATVHERRDGNGEFTIVAPHPQMDGHLRPLQMRPRVDAPVETPMVRLEHAVLRALLEAHGVADDGAVNDRWSGEGIKRLQTALAPLGPMPRDTNEQQYGQWQAALEIEIIQARIDGLRPEIIASIVGRPYPTGLRLWAPAGSTCTAREESEREAARQKERAEAAHARNAAAAAAPSKKSCKDLGLVLYLRTEGYQSAQWFSELSRGFDCRLPDGTMVAKFARTPGLVWPEERAEGSRILQEDDLCPLPNSEASKPPSARDDRAVYSLLARMPLDTSTNPGWGSCSRATDSRLLEMLDASGPRLLMQASFGPWRTVLFQQIVRGGCKSPARALRMIWDWMEKYNAPKADHNWTFLGQDMPRGAIKYEELRADLERAAASGHVPWASLNVPILEAAGQAWESLVAPLRALFASKPEVTSAEALAVTGLPDVPQSHNQVVAAAEALGVRKSRLSGPEGRYYAFVTNGLKELP
jgi:hypothetical protein